MGSGRRGVIAACVALMLGALVGGCSSINGDVGSGRIAVKAGRLHVTLDGTVPVPGCTFAGTATITYSCTFRDAFTPGTRTSVVTLTGLNISDGVSGPPLIIVQLPADASNITGTFNNGHGGTGALVVDAGHAELPMDATTNLIAESGMLLAVVSLPAGTPSDSYFVVFAYDSVNSTRLKALAAAPVFSANRTYYPSLVPCTNRFTSLPDVPVPQTPIETAIALTTLFPAYVSCSGKAYDYTTTPATPVTVVEYYNASLDHYFITWVPGEIAILDAGITIRGWVRTGRSFQTYSVVQPGTSDICRFYIPPELGDSHFFGRGTTECDATGVAHPTFVNEDPRFMHMFLPVSGRCPPGTVAVYRVFSNRADANHRYMTDPALRDQMVQRGWLAEGDGPDLVVMCAPA
jgi:hypothetical protein